jgi:hypothetical protein
MGLNQKQINSLLPIWTKGAQDAQEGALSNASQAQRAQNQNDAALAQLIKGKQMEAENERSKQMQALENSRAEFQSAQDAVNAAPGQHITAKIGNASYGESMVDPSVRQDRLNNQEAKALKGLADKTIGSIHGQTDALEMLQNALHNPSSVNDQQLQSGLARMAEGPGQRLLQTIVHVAGIAPTGAGSLVDVQNFIRGGGMSKLQPGQAQAIQDSINQHRGLLQQQFKDAEATYAGQAGIIAPHLGQDKISAMHDSYSVPLQGAFQRLEPPKTAIDPSVRNQTTSSPSMVSRAADSLMSLIKGQSSASSPGRQVSRVLQNKTTGQKKIIYSDGSEEIQ